MEWLSTTWDVLRDTLLLAWAATAVFCAIASAAVAAWGGLSRVAGAVAGALTLYLGLAVVAAVAAARVNSRRTAALTGAPGAVPPPGTPVTWDPSAPAVPTTPGPPGTGNAWQRWTRTPPPRRDLVTAGVAVALAVAWTATLGTAWVRFTAVDRGVVALGAFEVQLGLFVVLTALAALAVAAGVLRWGAAGNPAWPVLLAWFGAWWALVVLLVRRAAGDGLDDLSRLLRDQARDRLGYDLRPDLGLGPAWTLVGVLAVVTLVFAVVLVASCPRSRSAEPAGGSGTMPSWPTPRP